jgi:hypothetical protein
MRAAFVGNGRGMISLLDSGPRFLANASANCTRDVCSSVNGFFLDAYSGLLRPLTHWRKRIFFLGTQYSVIFLK